MLGGMAKNCPELSAKGSRCQQGTGTRGPDDDGVVRCKRHTTRPEDQGLKAREDAGGAQGKAREVAHRKTERLLRAQGKAPPIPKRRGVRGTPPLATPLPPVIETAAQFAQAPAKYAGGSDVLGAETLRDRLGAFDLKSAEGRSAYRHALAGAAADGVVDARTTEVLAKIATEEGKDAPPGADRRTLSVRFEMISTRDQADAYKAAQEIRNGAN